MVNKTIIIARYTYKAIVIIFALYFAFYFTLSDVFPDDQQLYLSYLFWLILGVNIGAFMMKVVFGYLKKNNAL